MPENIAPVSARVVAYTADIGLAAAGCVASLRLCFPREGLVDTPHGRVLVLLWTAAFLLFQAYMSCDGRRSPGKAALGLRVVDAEGEPLEAGKAFLRAAAYLLSSIANLGFAWALVDPSRRCWHDLIAGSYVVEDAPRSSRRRMLVRGGAVLCVAGFLGLWYVRQVVIPRYRRIIGASSAVAALEEMKTLERLYFYGHGQYTTNLDALGIMSGAPADFARDDSALLDMAYGVQISTSRTTYTISAHARNDVRTPVSVEGP